MEIRDDSVIVRPELHAPELDEYDEVNISDIIADQKNIEIGNYVSYSIKNTVFRDLEDEKYQFSH